MTNPFTSFLAALGGLFHRSPPDPVPNNTPLSDATQQLKNATVLLQQERQQAAAQAQQLISVTEQYNVALTSQQAAEAKVIDLQATITTMQAQLDALPDAETVNAAITEIQQDATAIAPAPTAT